MTGSVMTASDRPASSLEPVVQESTPAIIARALRRAISAGEFPPGSQLGEATLAKQLGVSRGPLREAMQRLTQEGLLISRRNRGLFVPELTADAVADMYLLRTTIERAAVERILAAGTGPSCADRLDAVVARMSAAATRRDSPAMMAADLEFHRTIVESAESDRLSRVHETVIVETSMCLRAMAPTYAPGSDRVSEHREIADAVRAGDRTRAVAVLEAHMSDGLARLTGGTAEPAAGHLP
ncbi:putative GntR family transcriptional regulator [Gordonia sihwensis NBRC 108236]|uniref:GntR family transcriptional regulator n=3 Tax=Gordoniaceae TaxID=85026 RepID=A0ABP5UJX7_9ACTN|nr:putative GntR family transcriptional regulator [Gordonia sihwensis NBRC 108236]